MSFFSLKAYKTNTLGGVLIHLFLVFFLILLLCLIYFYGYLPSTTNHGETLTVPNIEGMHMDELESFLVNRNLRFEVNDSSYAKDVPPLTILKQFPKAGSKVKENRKIYISVNRVTPPSVPMPNIKDRSLTNAEAVLKGNELVRGKIELKSSPFLNLVLEMKWKGKPIAPDTRIPKGSVIDLVIGDGGPNSLEAPDLIGLEFEDAKLLIFGSNLNFTLNVESDTTGLHPVVVRQTPQSGDKVKVGDIIEIWLKGQ